MGYTISTDDGESWPFQVYVNEDGHLAVSKHDTDSGSVGEVIFHNNVHGDVELEVRRHDEAAFGSLIVRLV